MAEGDEETPGARSEEEKLADWKQWSKEDPSQVLAWLRKVSASRDTTAYELLHQALTEWADTNGVEPPGPNRGLTESWLFYVLAEMGAIWAYAHLLIASGPNGKELYPGEKADAGAAFFEAWPRMGQDEIGEQDRGFPESGS